MEIETPAVWAIPPVPVVDWAQTESLVRAHGITVERPRGTAHPHYPEIIYPLDYGFINQTLGEDGEPIDVFVGSAESLGLVAAARTQDRRKGDTEIKLLWNCTPAEIYLVYGFLNFSPRHMTASLTLRWPLTELWKGHIQ
jgi:inorganic pyrophosphatase